MPSQYVSVPNDWARNPKLSWKAKGLLTYILSHAPGYELTIRQMMAEGVDGKDAIQSGMNELVKAGYVTRERVRHEDGTRGGYRYQVNRDGLTSDGSSHGGETRSGSEQGKRPPVAPGPVQAMVGKPALDLTRENVAEQQVTARAGFPALEDPPTKKTTQEKENSPSGSSARTHTRGTRLSDDFAVTAEMREWYRVNIGSRVDGVVEHAKFCDHWRAQPGQKGVKVDWVATWRNWMRRAAEGMHSTDSRASSLPASNAPDVIPVAERCPKHPYHRKSHCPECRAAEIGLFDD